MLRSEHSGEGGGWPALRDDLEVSRIAEGDSAMFLVRDPRTGELFEFAEEDYFLLRALDGRTGGDVTIHLFEQRYEQQLGREQLEMFIEMVAEWGLLRGHEPAERIAQPPPVAEADVLPMAREGSRGRELVVTPLRPEQRGQSAGRSQRAAGGQRSARGGSQRQDYFGEPPFGQGGRDYVEIEAEEPLGARHERVRARLEAGPAMQDREDHPHWSWFNPTGLFTVLAHLLSPLRFLAYLVPVLALAGAWTIFGNFDAFMADFGRFRTPLTLFERLLFSLVTVNLIAQVGRGVICCGVGGEAQSFGIKMAFGLIPRFTTQLGGFTRLDRRELLWVHGGPLLLRLALFGSAGILWFMARPAGNLLAAFALMLATVALLSFLFSVNPLLRNNGYYVLTVLLDMPDLRQRANRALFGGLKGRLPPQAEEENQAALRAFALASFIVLFGVIGIALILIGRWLELTYQGTGVALFLLLFVFLVLRFRSQIEARKVKRREDRQERIAEMRGGGRAGTARREGGYPQRVYADEALGRARAGGDRPEKRRGNPFLRFGLLAIFIGVLFLPYHYESGGPVQVMPMQRQEIHAEISGLVKDVAFSGGESVSAGTVIATLSSAEEQKAVQTTRAAISEQQAKLDELLSRPRPEDVALARRELETARVQARFSKENVQRLKRVYESGSISLEDWEEAKKKMQVDEAEVLEAQANLTRVSAGAHPKEIEAARYELEGLREQLLYHEEQLGKTQLVMPFHGRIVTINLRDKIGQFLDKGALFAIVENDDSVRVQFEIPQADVAEVEIGGTARVKIWAYPDRTFTGEVVDISPVVEEQDYGKVVLVTTVIPNPNGVLKSGMTGFGKIDGGTKPVIVAFSRAIVRFFMIEFWSWLP